MKNKKSIYVHVEKRTKRKLMPSATTEEKQKAKNEVNIYKLGRTGYPSDHPFNKEGYRYILAEPDPFAPHRKEFDECEDWAGKPIPGWLYRQFSPLCVLAAMHDRAPQLKVAEDRLTVTGEKGYCMIRATHGVHFGNWYYEVDLLNVPEGGATRLGWSQELANLHGPCGYDRFGYSWRSRKGTIFNDSKGKHYSEQGYGQGDTVGCLIKLPEDVKEDSPNRANYLGNTYKECPLVKVKNFLYFETKDNIQQANKNLRPLEGSQMIFYRNGENLGVAVENFSSGIYYPTVSFFKNVVVKFNFGPDFKHPPKDVEFRGMHELAEEQAVRQTMADMTYFIENDGNLNLDTFYSQSGLLKG